jgi:2'-5' RNA ligase
MDPKSLIQMPGYRYNEYLLVLSPHEELWNRIKKIKEEFSEKYKSEQAKWGKPHITLVNFIQFEMSEERIISRLKTIAMGYTPFKVELKNFDSFPSHTIYINIESKQQVQNLIKELKPAQQLLTLNKDNKPHFLDNPHLTIARKLLPWQHEKSWIEYSHRQFTGRFIADSMMLIKRKIGDKPYQVAQRFNFMNLPVSTKQGELFM